jgi:hypothetical protein
MTAGYIGNRHSRLSCLSQEGQLLIHCEAPAALDSSKNLDSINAVRHRRITRLTPSSYLRSYVRSKWGLLHKPTPTIIEAAQTSGGRRTRALLRASSAEP